METSDTPTPPHSHTSSSPSLGRLLIVDDETELMTALCETLGEQGYETTGFGSGHEALETLKDQDFDVLLTDLMMPEMDGIALLKAGIEMDPHLIGVIMTGQGTVQTAVEAMKIGAFDYVLKPFKLNALLPVLSRAMNVRQLRMENVQLRETVAIYQLSQTIAFTLDLNTILSKVADAAQEQCEADEVSIMLPTREGDELYIAAVRDGCREGILGQRVPIMQGIAGWVARHREPLMLHGEVKDPRFAPSRPRADIRSAICVPLLVGGKCIGVLNVNATKRRRQFTMGQVKALNILATTAASALEGAWLYTQVREAEEKYRSIFENTVEGIYQSTPEGRFLTANPSLARMLGYECPEELTAALTDVAHQTYVDLTRRTEFLRLLEEEGRVSGFESQVRRRDGMVIWVSENARAVRDERGALLYCEGTVEEVTRRKQAEEALRESNRLLEEALAELKGTQEQVIQQERLRALGEMASGIAHDFNNALSPILGFSELLLAHPERWEDKERVARYLRTMNTAAKDAASVVRRMRDFYRGREPTEPFQPTNLNDLVHEAVSLTQPKWKDQALASGVTIGIQVDLQPVPVLSGSEAELREALMNLILNATDAILQKAQAMGQEAAEAKEGTITLRTRIAGREEWEKEGIGDESLAPRLTHSLTHVVVEVSDTGVGMSEETRLRCLEPFFTTKGEGGTGLGLAMVYGIVRRHEGSVEINTSLGQGTTFTLRFPIQTALKAEGRTEGAAALTRPLKVLLVDDESAVRETLAEYLQSEGHLVEAAVNGPEGFAKFDAGQFDLVITDRAMPEMNGDQLAAAIKERAPNTPIIMLTGFGDMMETVGEKPPGVDTVLGKPVTIGELLRAIAKVTSESSQRV